MSIGKDLQKKAITSLIDDGKLLAVITYFNSYVMVYWEGKTYGQTHDWFVNVASAKRYIKKHVTENGRWTRIKV